MTKQEEYTHYTNDGHKTTICGLEFWMDATDIPTDYRITCPVCLEMLSNKKRIDERTDNIIKTLRGGADSV